MQNRGYEIVYNIHQFIFNQSIEAFNALYLFKEYFGALLDQNIIAIYLNATMLIVLKKTDEHDDDLYTIHETTYLKKEMPLDIINKIYDDPEIIKNYINVTNLSTELSKVKYEQDYEAICKSIKLGLEFMSTEHLKELALFGGHILAYELHESNCKYKKQNEALARANSNYQKSQKYIIDCLFDVAKLARATILEKCLIKIKQQFETMPPTLQTIPQFRSMWEQMGYYLFLEDNAKVEELLNEPCKTLYDGLKEDEKISLDLKDLPLEDLELDIHYPLLNFNEILYQDGKEVIKNYCIKNARKDWEMRHQIGS